MGDNQTPEPVEHRAEQLLEMIEKQRDKADPPKKQWNLAALAKWYLEQKQQIEAVALDEEDRGLLLSQLEVRYMRLQEKHLRELQP